MSPVTPGRGSLSVTWSEPDNTTDFDVTAYDLRYKRSDDNYEFIANWNIHREVWTSAVGGNLDYEVTGLAGNTSYDVEVRAVNQWDPGEWSDIVSGTPANVLPSFAEGSTTTRSVEENTPAGGSVGNPVAAIDDDSPTYTMTGSDAALFDIDGATGQVLVGSGTNLDYESGVTEYSVTVTATDQSQEVATIDVTISVLDVSLGTIGDTYDVDVNEAIDESEVLAAVQDYFAGLITGGEVLEVVRLFFDR